MNVICLFNDVIVYFLNIITDNYYWNLLIHLYFIHPFPPVVHYYSNGQT